MVIGHDPQREQLELFHAFSGELPARDVPDLMAYRLFFAGQEQAQSAHRLLSAKIFKRLNPSLSVEWAEIRKR